MEINLENAVPCQSYKVAKGTVDVERIYLGDKTVLKLLKEDEAFWRLQHNTVQPYT